ncbi:MAG: amidohydrolase family protein [Pseudomonadota bacterium]|nr:amidohydrolase family protein [Pseudomonadota bacterium]
MASVSRRELLVGAAALAATLAAPGRARAADGERTYSNARILVGDGTELTGGIRTFDGLITAVGPEIAGGEDLQGAVVYPGVYLAGAALGLSEVDLEGGSHDHVEGGGVNVPQARVIDAYNPRSAVIDVCRTGGIMGALVIPSGGAVAGQAAWMRTFGDTVGDALLRAPAGVCFGLGHAGTGGPGGPTSRMGIAMVIRDLLEANPAPASPAADEKKGRRKKGDDAAPEKPPTSTQAILHALHRRETKAIFTAERASDILLALELADAYDLDAVLLGGAEAHLVADQLAAAHMPVLLGPITTQPSSFDTLNATYENAARLHAKGVRFAFRVGGAHNARDLTTEAGIAVAHGLPREAAVAALTGNGPGFWKLDVGRIAVGCEASFVMTDGDPLQPRTRVLRHWGRGVEIPVHSRQTDLYERFKTLK